MDTVYNPKWVSNTTKCPTLSVTGTSKVVYPHASGFTQGSNLEGTGGVLTSEEGHRGSQMHSSEERVLQQTFSGEEKIRGVETCHRPVSTQPVHSVSTLQDGNCGLHQTSTSKRGLGNIIGFNRCLLPCDVSSVLFRRENISVLPFGLCVSPYVFSRVLKAVLRHIRLQGIRVHAYLDDWIQPSASEGQSWHHSRKLLSTVLDLGFLPNWDKSELIPVQDFNFLGAHFNLGLALVSPSADRVASFQQAMTKLLGAKEASARQLHSLLGQMESMANLLTLGRAFKRCLQWELKERWSQSSAQWDSKIVLGPWFSNAVRPWTDIDFLKSMSPLHHPVPQLHLFTDSSLEGWGAHMEEHMASGYWSPAWKTQHINVLEMQAVWLALQAFADYIKGNSILLSTDNTTVAAYLNRQGGTHSLSLCNMAVEIMLWCAKNRVHIKARYLPGRLNALADCLSRKGNIVQTEWSLNQRVADLVFQLWGTPHIDLFATRLNRKVQIFVSPVPDPLAHASDALSLSWKGMWAYAFPPFPLILTTLRKVLEEECLVCLIAPLWAGQAWFPLLLSLVVAPPIQLPVRRDLLCQPVSRLLHPTPQIFHLHAWLLCNNTWRRQAFLGQLPDESIQQKDLPQTLSMIIDGNLGWIGVSEGKWIPSIRQ